MKFEIPALLNVDFRAPNTTGDESVSTVFMNTITYGRFDRIRKLGNVREIIPFPPPPAGGGRTKNKMINRTDVIARTRIPL